MKRVFILALIFGVIGLVARWQWSKREHRHDKLILAAAQQYSVDPALVKAVVWRESRFNEKAVGRAGEIGLMQIRALAAQEWADAEKLGAFRHSDLFDPGKNTMAGAWYLGKLIKRYKHTDNPLPYALADYNAGRSNVLKWLAGEGATNSAVFVEQIRFPGTRKYVATVLDRHEHYRARFPAKVE